MNERPSEEEIERARRAIMDAPTTESGLVLPPHVEAERQAKLEVERAAAPVPANRAERRWQAKQERRRRSLEARRARLTAAQREALSDAEKAFEALPEELAPAAMGVLKQLAAMTPEQRAETLREMEASDAA